MSDGNRRDQSQARRLIYALGVLAVVVTALAFMRSTGEVRGRQAATEQAAREHCTGEDYQDCQNLFVAIRTANAAEDAVNFSFWQSLVGLIGVAGVAATVFYARRAWIETKRSADADNDALVETRNGLAQARADAVEQGERMIKQLELATISTNEAVRSGNIAAEANDLTKELFIAQNRPNIVANISGFRHVHITENGEISIAIDMHLTNNGRVLASRVAALGTHEVLSGFFPGNLFVPWMKEAAQYEHRDAVSINIGAGEVGLVVPSFVLTADEFQRSQFGESFAVAMPTAIFYEYAAFKKGYLHAFDLMVIYNGNRADLLSSPPGPVDTSLFQIQRMIGEARV